MLPSNAINDERFVGNFDDYLTKNEFLESGYDEQTSLAFKGSVGASWASGRRQSGRAGKAYTMDDMLSYLGDETSRGISDVLERGSNSLFGSGTAASKFGLGKRLEEASNMSADEQKTKFGTVANAQRFVSQGMTGMAFANQAVASGYNAQYAGQFADNLASMSADQYNTTTAILSGDPYATTNNFGMASSMFNFGSVGVTTSGFSTVAGQGISQIGNGSVFSGLKNSDGGSLFNSQQMSQMRTDWANVRKSTGYQLATKLNYFDGLSEADKNKGTLEWQAESADLSAASAGYSASMSIYQTRTNMALMTGGATGVNAQGQAIGGDGLKGLQALYAKHNFQFDTGLGMGMWQIEDRQVAIGREKQDFGIMQDKMSIDMGRENMDLKIRQFEEKFGLNQRQFDYNTTYQRKEMNIGRGQSLEQRAWNKEDMSINRSTANMQFGWQMEDFDRNIRYARGRQRVDMMREKDRAVTMQSVNEGGRDREESRFDKRAKWEDEAFTRQKNHFEKGVEFQKEEMALQRKHFYENIALDKKQQAMREMAHAMQNKWIMEERKLEDESRRLSRINKLWEAQISIEMAKTQAGFAARQAEISKAIAGLGVTMQTNDGLMQKMLKSIGLGDTAVQNIIASVNALIEKAKALYLAAGGNGSMAGYNPNTEKLAAMGGDATDPMSSGTTYYGFANGGFTGIGRKWETAGIVHKGEWVVPQEGALVVRGDSPDTIELLRELVAVMKQIRDTRNANVNAVIQTSAPQVKVQDLLNVAYSQVRK
jgi:hypothetical protein